MLTLLLAFGLAFALTYGSIPAVIHLAKTRKLFDLPNERSAHTTVTPRLGGVALFVGVAGSLLFFGAAGGEFRTMASLLLAFLLVFLIGIYDDLMPVSPLQKIAIETAATCALMLGAGVRITSFYGLFGVETLPLAVSAGLTVFVVIAIVNAFNLIDGINGLAGSLAALIFTFFGSWFALNGQSDWAFVAFTMVGATMAFLRFNLLRQAKIFMGDCGSLFFGFGCAALGIHFLETDFTRSVDEFRFPATLAVGLSLVILPLFDMSRLFFQRIRNGKSPFLADRNHIHHLLLDCGFTHLQSTGLLLVFNGGLVLLVIRLQPFFGTLELIFIQLLLLSGFSLLVYQSARQRRTAHEARTA